MLKRRVSFLRYMNVGNGADRSETHVYRNSRRNADLWPSFRSLRGREGSSLLEIRWSPSLCSISLERVIMGLILGIGLAILAARILNVSEQRS